MQYILFIAMAPLAAFICLSITVYIQRYRDAPITSALIWLMFTIAGWLIFNTLELASTSEHITVLWSKISYFFIATTPVAWFAFALRYTDRLAWLAPARFATFFVIPTITVSLALTNELHHLLWKTYTFTSVEDLLAFHVTYGPWFWVNITYDYVLVFLGAYLVIWKYFKSFRLYRQQSTWVVVGALTPILANLIYVLDLIPNLKKDYTPISFAVASTAFAIGIFRYRLLDLRPMARDVVIDSMHDAVLTLDEQRRVVDLNPAALDFINLAPHRIIGQPMREVLKNWPDLLGWLEDAPSQAGQDDIILVHQGQPRYYDLQVSSLHNHNRAHSMGQVLILRDVTERKRAELALREQTQELELRNTELDAFAHTVAHDLKNPLTSIIGYSDFLQAQALQIPVQDLQHYSQRIAEGGRKMRSIIDALLLLASVRQLDTVDIRPLDMGAIVSDAQAQLAALIDKRQAQISVPEHWPSVLGYAPWIEEVWVNYISNALKYGGQPNSGIPPRLELGFSDNTNTRSCLSSDCLIKFWVRDNGPGIPEAAQDQVFTLFTRLEGHEMEEGHGIGLSIVKRITEKLGGTVGVESQIGEGSRFWFTLPIDKAKEPVGP